MICEHLCVTLISRDNFVVRKRNNEMNQRKPVADPAPGKGAEKHEIYVAAFGRSLFYNLLLQSGGGAWPPRPPPGSATESLWPVEIWFDYVNILIKRVTSVMASPSKAPSGNQQAPINQAPINLNRAIKVFRKHVFCFVLFWFGLVWLDFM